MADALGQHMMVYLLKEGALPVQELPPSPWYFTDDTYMALSIISLLCQGGKIDQDRLAADFALRYQQDAYRGYGPGMHILLQRINGGQSWQEASRRQFAGQGSFGNGAAMRVTPLGAYFAAVIEQVQASAEVTHAHPEGVPGAIAVAVAAARAWRLRKRGAHENAPGTRSGCQSLGALCCRETGQWEPGFRSGHHSVCPLVRGTVSGKL